MLPDGAFVGFHWFSKRLDGVRIPTSEGVPGRSTRHEKITLLKRYKTCVILIILFVGDAIGGHVCWFSFVFLGFMRG